MKLAILSFCGMVALVSNAPVHAQTIYTASAGGNWSSPSTWVVSGTPNSSPVPNNQYNATGGSISNNIVYIHSAVVLDADYTITGSQGKIVITPEGSLTDGPTGNTLYFGQQQDADMTRLELSGNLEAGNLIFYKGDAELTLAARMTTDCNVTVYNQSDVRIGPNAKVQINGNFVVFQGNPSVVGTGALVVQGCVPTNNNGSLNGIFGQSLQVCVRGQANSCGMGGLTCSDRVQDAIGINTCRPLPVELTSFAGQYRNRVVQLSWSTAQEQNAAWFAVERSVDASRFESISTVRAAGNSTTPREYRYQDATATCGLIYYRLKQIDADGEWKYSKVVTVQAGKGEQLLNAYGASGILNVEMQTTDAIHSIRVTDIMGRLVHREVLADSPTGQVVRQIRVPRSAEGVYIVQAITASGAFSRKFYLQE